MVMDVNLEPDFLPVKTDCTKGIFQILACKQKYEEEGERIMENTAALATTPAALVFFLPE